MMLSLAELRCVSGVRRTIPRLARVCHISRDEHGPKYALRLRWNVEGAACNVLRLRVRRSFVEGVSGVSSRGPGTASNRTQRAIRAKDSAIQAPARLSDDR